jgi:predicted cupin superfamily sugar epimerase
MTDAGSTRPQVLMRELGLQPHPEGGHYRELFRSARRVRAEGARESRSALTSIDFLLRQGECSAWHRVAADEVWHLLEGPALRLWLLAPDLSAVDSVQLAAVSATTRPRHVVPANWWQAAEPEGGFAYVGATVGPGFEFADFTLGRDDAALAAALDRLAPGLRRLL